MALFESKTYSVYAYSGWCITASEPAKDVAAGAVKLPVGTLPLRILC
jgi:hypothetical protein